MTWRTHPDTGQPILVGGDLVRLTDPAEICAQAVRFRLRTIAGEFLFRTDIGLPDEQLLEKGVSPIEVANIVREVLREPPIDSLESIDDVTPAAEPDSAGRLEVALACTPKRGAPFTLTETI